MSSYRGGGGGGRREFSLRQGVILWGRGGEFSLRQGVILWGREERILTETRCRLMGEIENSH